MTRKEHTTEGDRQTIKVGDRVMYSKAWLQFTGNIAGVIPHARGIVNKLTAVGMLVKATIDWGEDEDEVPPRVMTCNLTKCN